MQAGVHAERILLEGQTRQKKRQQPSNRCKPGRNGVGAIIQSAAASAGQPRGAGAEGEGRGSEG